MRSPLLILSTAALIVSCGDDAITAPAAGTISVMLSGSTGTRDQGTYAIILDGGSPLGLRANSGTVTLSDVPAGSHLIELVGIPYGCGVGGDNPRTVSVSAEKTAHVFFGLACMYPPPGIVQVTATSSGPAPASYNVHIGLLDEGTVPANGTQTFPYIRAGSQSVSLTNVPANCEIQPKFHQVEVVYAETVTVSFTVTCT